MQVVIRVDASQAIGTGHVMRCLTLADYLTRDDAEVNFICRELTGHMCDFIESKGFQVARLPAPDASYESTQPDDYQSWLAVPWQIDANQTAVAIGSLAWDPDWLIVDHYGLDGKWESRLRGQARRLMVIDDLANREHDCDLLLDQNAYHDQETRYDSYVAGYCRRLLGPNYALLRPEFRAARVKTKQQDETPRLLIFFGGVDRRNLAGQAIAALTLRSNRDLKIDLIAGQSNPHQENLRNFCCSCAGATFYNHVENMASMMAQADLALGSPGTATWERCAVGLPSVVIASAANQEAVGESVERLGIGRYLGRASEVSYEALADVSLELLDNSDRLYAMRKACLGLVDGLGSRRVCEVLESQV